MNPKTKTKTTCSYRNEYGALKFGYLPNGDRYIDENQKGIWPYNEFGQKYVDDNGNLRPGFNEEGFFYLAKDGNVDYQFHEDGSRKTCNEIQQTLNSRSGPYSKCCIIL